MARRGMTGGLISDPTSVGRGGARSGSGGFSFRYAIQDASKVSKKQLARVMIFSGSYPMTYFSSSGEETSKDILEHGLVLRHYAPGTKQYVRCLDELQPGTNRDGEFTIYPAGVNSCNGCYEAEDKDKKRVSFATPSTYWNVIEMSYFHQVESERCNERTGKPYQDWVRCIKAESCELCKDDVERSFGRKQSLILNWSQTRQLTRFDLLDLAQRCVCSGALEPVKYTCEKCGAVMIDCNKDDPTDLQLIQFRSLEYPCKCGHIGLMLEHNRCDRCDKPEPMSLKNAAFKVYFPAKDKAQTQDAAGRKDTTLEFAAPALITDEMIEAVKHLMRPFDINRILPKLSLAEQAKKLGVPNHFAKETEQPRRAQTRPDKASAEKASADDVAAVWEDDDDDEIPF